jgi:nicotinate-nucleotide pyrophosphorylase (carboxylating)
MNFFPISEAKHLIELGLLEDVKTGDITTELSFPSKQNTEGYIRAKEEGVLAGVPFAKLVLEMMKSKVKVIEHKCDGDLVMPGDKVLTFEGDTSEILIAERTILNFMQRLSGIATATYLFTKELEGSNTKVLDTRKTLPAYRLLDKYAVLCGGGVNHRVGLYDMVLIKDNHINASGGISQVLTNVFAGLPKGMKVEIEVENLAQLEDVLKFPINRVLLDNMSNELMSDAVQLVQKLGHQTDLEASGNMTLARAKQVAQTGVDYISVGAITHSVMALDLSMRFK